MGDNPTAGGAGDVTWTLREILARPEFKTATGPSLIYASIPGPELIKQAMSRCAAEHVEGYVGAHRGCTLCTAVGITGMVKSIRYGDTDAEVEVVVQVGSVHIIVTQKRKPYHKEIDFTRLGLKSAYGGYRRGENRVPATRTLCHECRMAHGANTGWCGSGPGAASL